MCERVVHTSILLGSLGVDVELLEEPEGWSPYLSLEDAYRLDDVREALRQGDVKTAAKYSRVFSLTPVAV